MTWWQAVVLGLVQGLTEFLPISSSAHLRIVGALMLDGQDVGATFTAVTQIGTELAVIVYFRYTIWRILTRWFQTLRELRGPDGWRNPFRLEDPDARMGWLIIAGSIPIVVLGVLFQDAIEGALRDLRFTAFTLAFFGALLWLADRWGRQTKDLTALDGRDGILYGFAQAMALIPGVSRSGGTITAGLAMGYTREAAARYSFLLAIPAVLGSGLYQLAKALGGHTDTTLAVSGGATLLATIVAFVVGFAVIVWFLRFVSTRSYVPFAVYRFALAGFIVLLLLTGALTPTAGS
ncbi:MAG TPA: undecaprenyl-diphosphatase [Micrococcales bacterium]|uniref:undecaprenyl-diphosphate phosphatase n=1 Tax=Miniimonas arenae TaxID=676201 RepID=UPI000ED0F607|nr:undecaprenyl-diphosphate phosphatase [Miniimonas arenae]HCX83865.1 undecaprenyl-diphosphatase [Micrococcales bacterium]